MIREKLKFQCQNEKECVSVCYTATTIELNVKGIFYFPFLNWLCDDPDNEKNHHNAPFGIKIVFGFLFWFSMSMREEDVSVVVCRVSRH